MIEQTNITDKIIWIKEELICVICSSKMQHNPDGIVLMTYPPKYPHICCNKNCGNTVNALAIYPRHIMDIVE